MRLSPGQHGALPGHLPREEIVLEPESTVCPCCGGALHRIGEDTAERLDVVPARIEVIVTRRPKYGCRACEGAVVQAPAPARLIEGGLPTEAPPAPAGAGPFRGRIDGLQAIDGGARAGRQGRRPPAALSPVPDLRPPCRLR
jgi:hypothetical protein